MSEEIVKLREVSKYTINDSPLGFNLVNDIEDYVKYLQQENTQLKQQLKDKDEKISEIIEYIKENINAELLNGSIWIDKCKLLNILESNKED